jgi:hypothetical protein
MMTEWLDKAKEMAEVVTDLPASRIEWAATVVLCVVGFLLFMALCGMALRLPIAGGGQRLAAGVLTLVLGLAAATATALYAAPKIENESLRRAVLIAAPIVVFLAIAVPLGALILRTGYFRTLFSLTVSLACAWALSLLGSTIFLAARSGIEQAKQMAGHKEEVNQAIEKKEELPPGKVKPDPNPRRKKEMREKAESGAAR